VRGQIGDDGTYRRVRTNRCGKCGRKLVRRRGREAVCQAFAAREEQARKGGGEESCLSLGHARCCVTCQSSPDGPMR
jgi:hypothetical protein